eukprot:1161617-Pelagomonas_calceolata.AAC.6
MTTRFQLYNSSSLNVYMMHRTYASYSLLDSTFVVWLAKTSKLNSQATRLKPSVNETSLQACLNGGSCTIIGRHDEKSFGVATAKGEYPKLPLCLGQCQALVDPYHPHRTLLDEVEGRPQITPGDLLGKSVSLPIQQPVCVGFSDHLEGGVKGKCKVRQCGNYTGADSHCSAS